ncbi:MAG: hypothetical protein QOK05_1441 [Chloroflexota bacterium]|jgi:hypothetical protein|nr:hypothetical protein [Chloroflexota bacterium]
MDGEAQFDQLARRDEELRVLTSRGRRRSLLIMILAFVPSPFLVMLTNDDRSVVSVIPVGIAAVVAISYSWTKWQRRPEDSQSVAFVGLDRRRRWATYRSLRDGTGIDDPVVLTIVESIHHHLGRSALAVVATMVVIAAMAVALVEVAGNDVSIWVPAVIVMVAGGAIAGHRWVMNRAGVVIDRSRQH